MIPLGMPAHIRKITRLAWLVAALSIPTGAFAADRAATDGALAVSAAEGTISVQGRGLLFGQLDQGALSIIDFRPDDPTSAITVSGAKARTSWGVTVYAGTSVRFLLPAGKYVIRLNGSGIDLSAVGKGTVSATGAGSLDDGTFAVNGGKPQTLSTVAATQSFGAKLG